MAKQKRTTLSFTDEELIALGEELMIARSAIQVTWKNNHLESNVYDRICDITKRKDIPFSPFESARFKQVNKMLVEYKIKNQPSYTDLELRLSKLRKENENLKSLIKPDRSSNPIVENEIYENKKEIVQIFYALKRLEG